MAPGLSVGRSLTPQPAGELLPHGLGVRLAAAELHHLAHQASQGRVLAAPEILGRLRLGKQGLVAPLIELPLVADLDQPVPRGS